MRSFNYKYLYLISCSIFSMQLTQCKSTESAQSKSKQLTSIRHSQNGVICKLVQKDPTTVLTDRLGNLVFEEDAGIPEQFLSVYFESKTFMGFNLKSIWINHLLTQVNTSEYNNGYVASFSEDPEYKSTCGGGWHDSALKRASKNCGSPWNASVIFDTTDNNERDFLSGVKVDVNKVLYVVVPVRNDKNKKDRPGIYSKCVARMDAKTD